MAPQQGPHCCRNRIVYLHQKPVRPLVIAPRFRCVVFHSSRSALPVPVSGYGPARILAVAPPTAGSPSSVRARDRTIFQKPARNPDLQPEVKQAGLPLRHRGGTNPLVAHGSGWIAGWAWILLTQRPGKAQLMPVGVGDVEEALAPGGIAGCCSSGESRRRQGGRGARRHRIRRKSSGPTTTSAAPPVGRSGSNSQRRRGSW